MATKYSTQLTKVKDKALQSGYSLLVPNERFGRVRTDYFSFDGSVEGAVGGALVAGDTVELARLPVGARILGIFIQNPDFGTGVGIDIGLKATDGSGVFTKSGSSDDADYLANDVDLCGTVRTMPTNVNNLNTLYVTEKNVTLYGTIVDLGSYALTASSVLKGYVQYVVD